VSIYYLIFEVFTFLTDQLYHLGQRFTDVSERNLFELTVFT